MCERLRAYVCTNRSGSFHNLMADMQPVCVCVFVRSAMCLTTLTQHNEVDLAPVVLSPSLNLTVVLSRVGQQQVTDQQGGVSAQVLSCKGQAAGLAARRLIGVHLAPEEGNDLDILKRERERSEVFNICNICSVFDTKS